MLELCMAAKNELREEAEKVSDPEEQHTVK